MAQSYVKHAVARTSEKLELTELSTGWWRVAITPVASVACGHVIVTVIPKICASEDGSVLRTLVVSLACASG